jgi:hypothetical protein
MMYVSFRKAAVEACLLLMSVGCFAANKKKVDTVITLPEGDTTMVISKKTALQFSRRVFPSAGYSYIVVYKPKEFTAETDTQKLKMEEKDLLREMQRRPGPPGRRPPRRMMGADAAQKTVRLYPKKKGSYTFTVVVAERRKETTYTYSVDVK